MTVENKKLQCQNLSWLTFGNSEQFFEIEKGRIDDNEDDSAAVDEEAHLHDGDYDAGGDVVDDARAGVETEASVAQTGGWYVEQDETYF